MLAILILTKGTWFMCLKRIVSVFLVSLISGVPVKSLAGDVNFSLGGGYPFFVVPEFSYSSDGSGQRWYGNYKVGLDDGYSFGFEQGIDSENRHAFGFLVGAIGVKDDGRECVDVEENTDLADSVSESLVCALLEVFDEEITNGLGLSYSHNLRGLNNPGLRVRLEFGYGEGSESKEKRADGGVTLSYQF